MFPTVKIEGLKELSAQLKSLGDDLGSKTARQAVSSSVTPAVKELRNAAPEGSEGHKTYKGRWVAPGFTRRNIVKRSWRSKDRTRVGVNIGVRAEAFYSLQFVDQGTKYIAARDWVEPAFERSTGQVLDRLVIQLRRRIQKASA